MKKRDLTGQKFGKLTVEKLYKYEHKVDAKGKNRSQYHWLCKCSCGNETTATTQQLTSGDKKSCGCLKLEKARMREGKYLIDLTGKQFGKLTVTGLDRVEKKNYANGTRNIYYWNCKCDCGKEFSISGKKLQEGRTRSCKDIERNATKSYTQIGNEYAKKELLKEGTRLNFLSDKPSVANTTGVRGVDFSKEKGKYRARIRLQGKTHHLGYFDTIAEAKKAREKGEEKYFKPMLEKYDYNKETEEEDEEEFE